MKIYQPMITQIIKGTAAKKYHLMLGYFENVSVFIPKKLAIKVSGRKMNVIQLSLHRLRFKVREWRESRISTLL